MPPSNTPTTSNILPPISSTPIVDSRGILTPAGLNLFQQMWAGVFGGSGITPGVFLLGLSNNVNFNVSGDTPIALTLPTGAIGWRAALGLIYGTQGAFSAAHAGLFQLAFQQGTILLGQTALSGISAVGANTPGAALAFTPGQTAIWTYKTIYLNVGTPQGATALGNFYLYGHPVY